MEQTKILVVDDEARMRKLVKDFLTIKGYQVIEAGDGEEAVEIFFQQKDIALIVLDVMMPKMDGWEVLKTIRLHSKVPIIMLTARAEEVDKIIGLELGADDYMTKPFSPRELTARIKAVLRRSQKETTLPGELQVGRLRFNFSRYEVSMGGMKLELTPKEYELLKMLATNLGKVFTREQLLEKVWGYEYFGDTRTVDVHVRHLRAKLAAEPETADMLETVRGFGYRLRDAAP